MDVSERAHTCMHAALAVLVAVWLSCSGLVCACPAAALVYFAISGFVASQTALQGIAQCSVSSWRVEEFDVVPVRVLSLCSPV